MLTAPGWIQMALHTCPVVGQLLVGGMRVTEPCVLSSSRLAWACSHGS